MRLSQFRIQEATQLIQASLKNWFHLEPSHSDYPSFSHRMNCIKLLIELKLFDNALDVLEINLEENDEDGETWYLLGWCYYVKGGFIDKQNMDASCCEDAIEAFENVIQLQNQFQDMNPEWVEHSQELIQELKLLSI